MCVGNRIKIRRKELRITQKQLAESCEIKQSYIAMIEKGVRIPEGRVLGIIANKLGINRAFLETGVGEKFNHLMPDLSEFDLELIRTYKNLDAEIQKIASIGIELLSALQSALKKNITE